MTGGADLQEVPGQLQCCCWRQQQPQRLHVLVVWRGLDHGCGPGCPQLLTVPLGHLVPLSCSDGRACVWR